MLFNLEKLNKKDTKINLVSLTFSIQSYKKIKEKSLDNLTDTVKDFFHLLSKFGKLRKQDKKKQLFCWMINNSRSSRQARVEYFNYIFIKTYLILLVTAK